MASTILGSVTDTLSTGCAESTTKDWPMTTFKRWCGESVCCSATGRDVSSVNPSGADSSHKNVTNTAASILRMFFPPYVYGV
ncbi:MAG TPA: hypothetical protein ACFYD6_11750 [Candidatus Brocadiia bacterium]